MHCETNANIYLLSRHDSMSVEIIANILLIRRHDRTTGDAITWRNVLTQILFVYFGMSSNLYYLRE